MAKLEKLQNKPPKVSFLPSNLSHARYKAGSEFQQQHSLYYAEIITRRSHLHMRHQNQMKKLTVTRAFTFCRATARSMSMRPRELSARLWLASRRL
jgi:hypothetical protein